MSGYAVLITPYLEEACQLGVSEVDKLCLTLGQCINTVT